MSAACACGGQTPLPSIFSCWVRVNPISGLVTQPAGSPIIHSTNAAFRRGLPLLFSSVGAGAGPTIRSQRRTAGAYLPHSIVRLWQFVDPGRPPRVCPVRSRPSYVVLGNMRSRLLSPVFSSAGLLVSCCVCGRMLLGLGTCGQAIRNTRARWCGAPMSDARKVVHSASYPISVKSPSTRPSARRCPFLGAASSPPPRFQTAKSCII